jgi:exodeoxyribonuclease VIII
MKVTKDTNEQYHSQKDYISASGLKTIYLKSVDHLLTQNIKETPAMALGTAVHTAIYEPMEFYKENHFIPKIDRRTKAGKEQYAEEMKNAEGKKVFDEEQHQLIKTIVENVKNDDLAKKYILGECEYSHYLEHNGIKVRVRPDCINRVANFISDVKTCQSNTPYMDMLNIKDFRFIAIETNAPYSVQVYTLSEDMIDQGRAAYQQALADWQLYIETGVITGYKGERADDGSIIL